MPRKSGKGKAKTTHQSAGAILEPVELPLSFDANNNRIYLENAEKKYKELNEKFNSSEFTEKFSFKKPVLETEEAKEYRKELRAIFKSQQDRLKSYTINQKDKRIKISIFLAENEKKAIPFKPNEAVGNFFSFLAACFSFTIRIAALLRDCDDIIIDCYDYLNKISNIIKTKFISDEKKISEPYAYARLVVKNFFSERMDYTRIECSKIFAYLPLVNAEEEFSDYESTKAVSTLSFNDIQWILLHLEYLLELGYTQVQFSEETSPLSISLSQKSCLYLKLEEKLPFPPLNMQPISLEKILKSMKYLSREFATKADIIQMIEDANLKLQKFLSNEQMAKIHALDLVNLPSWLDQKIAAEKKSEFEERESSKRECHPSKKRNTLIKIEENRYFFYNCCNVIYLYYIQTFTPDSDLNMENIVSSIAKYFGYHATINSNKNIKKEWERVLKMIGQFPSSVAQKEAEKSIYAVSRKNIESNEASLLLQEIEGKTKEEAIAILLTRSENLRNYRIYISLAELMQGEHKNEESQEYYKKAENIVETGYEKHILAFSLYFMNASTESQEKAILLWNEAIAEREPFAMLGLAQAYLSHLIQYSIDARNYKIIFDPNSPPQYKVNFFHKESSLLRGIGCLIEAFQNDHCKELSGPIFDMLILCMKYVLIYFKDNGKSRKLYYQLEKFFKENEKHEYYKEELYQLFQQNLPVEKTAGNPVDEGSSSALLEKTEEESFGYAFDIFEIYNNNIIILIDQIKNLSEKIFKQGDSHHLYFHNKKALIASLLIKAGTLLTKEENLEKINPLLLQSLLDSIFYCRLSINDVFLEPIFKAFSACFSNILSQVNKKSALFLLQSLSRLNCVEKASVLINIMLSQWRDYSFSFEQIASLYYSIAILISNHTSINLKTKNIILSNGHCCQLYLQATVDQNKIPTCFINFIKVANQYVLSVFFNDTFFEEFLLKKSPHEQQHKFLFATRFLSYIPCFKVEVLTEHHRYKELHEEVISKALPPSPSYLQISVAKALSRIENASAVKQEEKSKTDLQSIDISTQDYYMEIDGPTHFLNSFDPQQTYIATPIDRFKKIFLLISDGKPVISVHYKAVSDASLEFQPQILEQILNTSKPILSRKYPHSGPMLFKQPSPHNEEKPDENSDKQPENICFSQPGL